MSFGTPSAAFNIAAPPAPVLPAAPAPPPMFGQPIGPGQKPSAKPSQPTFIGAGLFANPSNTGTKTLLGQ